MKIPKKITVRLGRARRLYVEKLIERGTWGDTPAEVIDRIFCAGLQQCVPPEWMREIVDLLERRRRK